MLGSCSVPGSVAAGKRPGGGALSGSAGTAGAGWPLDAMKRVTLYTGLTGPHKSTSHLL